ncbi:MAG: DegT/DnrJ/EryC1/StrS family aminotransferase [Bacteroidales bacterium]
MMREIQMVDLKAQYEGIKNEIDSAIKSVIDSASFVKGPEVKNFEEELKSYMGVKHVIACANGTDALQIAMMALGLEPGDEIITTNFTFIATVEVVALLGLRLVLVDPEPDTYNISPEAIRKAITPRTKAIVPVHLFGQCSNMEEIMKIASGFNLHVIEDAAQATGTNYLFGNGTTAKAGTIGHIGTTSFFPSKNLGCYGDGGALYTNDDNLAALVRSISNHGMTKRYYHDHIGVNSRLDTIQAAVLRVKLGRLDDYNEGRRKVAAYYDSQLGHYKGLMIPARSSFSDHIFHQYTIRLSSGRRDALREHLEKKGIPSMIYYPVPLHLQKAYSSLGYRKGDFPVTEKLSEEVLSLPMYAELDEEQLHHITSSILGFLENC